VPALVPYLWLAGGLQLLISSANFFAPRMLRYRENLARLTPTVREIFLVQNVLLTLTVATFGALSLLFADDLAGASRIGRYFSGFLALFWTLRFLAQIFVYNAEVKRRYPYFNVAFLVADAYLAGVFLVAVLTGGS
jgi:hypothetical protein